MEHADGDPAERERFAEAGDLGGEPACLASLLCPECGVVLDGGPHRPGCAESRNGEPHQVARNGRVRRL